MKPQAPIHFRRRGAAIALSIAGLAALLSCSVPPPTPTGDWALVGGAVIASTNTTSSITRVDESGSPVVATTVTGQNTAKITVSAWRTNAWDQLGGQLNTTATSTLAGMELDQAGNPDVAWTDGGSGYVSHWDGTAWQAVGAPIANLVNEELFIASAQPLTIGYYQLNGPVPTGRQLIIATWTGTSWTTLAPHVLPNYSTAFPVAVAMNGTSPVVAWQGIQPNGFVSDYVVEEYLGSAWNSLGAVFSSTTNVALGAVSLAAGDGTIGLTWSQTTSTGTPQGPKRVTDSYVDQWTSSAWQALGGDLGTSVPSALIEAGGQLTTAIVTNSAASVQTWNGTAWNAVGGVASVGVNVESTILSLSQSSAAMTLSWTALNHPDSTTFINEVHVSQIQLT